MENSAYVLDKYYQTVSERLRNAMEDSGMRQIDILEMAKNRGFTLRQAALSKILNNNGNRIPLNSIVEVANILEVDLNELLSFSEKTSVHRMRHKRLASVSESKEFITKPTDFKMKAYLNDYYTWFLPTKSSDNQIIKGKLSIFPSEDNQKTLVSFAFKTGKRNSEGDIEKKYYGTLTISPIMSAAYCLLQNDEIGEMSFILFRYIPVLYEKLCSSIALVLTSCAGGHRMPTAHRMIMSIDDIPDEEMEILKGQLFLNESEILISEKGMEAFLKDKNLSKQFVEYFKPENPETSETLFEGVTPSLYYYFNESLIREAFIDEYDKLNAIHLIRQYSTSPRYNKIGKCDELLMKTLSEDTNRKQIRQNMKALDNPET